MPLLTGHNGFVQKKYSVDDKSITYKFHLNITQHIYVYKGSLFEFDIGNYQVTSKFLENELDQIAYSINKILTESGPLPDKLSAISMLLHEFEQLAYAKL